MDGKNISTTEFIKECKDAEEFVNPGDKNFFLKIVKSRVTGEARNYLQFKKLDKLEQLLAELKWAFTPTKNMPQLQIELARVKQGPQEKVAEYGLRVTDILQKMKEITENSNSSTVQGLIEGATETATQCFKLVLRPEITIQMAGKLLTSFENAISTAIESELFIQQWNDLHEETSNNKKRAYCHLAESEAKGEPEKKRFKCFECGNPGHNYRHCPVFLNKRKTKCCNFCKILGHNFDECRKRLNQRPYNNNNMSPLNSTMSHHTGAMMNPQALPALMSRPAPSSFPPPPHRT